MADENKVVVQLVANLEDFTANMKAATDLMKSSAASMIGSLDKVAASTNALYQTNSRMYTQMLLSMQQSREAAQTSAASIVSAIQQQTSSLQSQSSSLNSSAVAQNNHAKAVGVNSTAIREMLVLMREGSRGDITRMAGSFSILTQQFEFGRNVIQALISPWTALIAVVGGYFVLQNSVVQAENKIISTLQLSAGAAGLTTKSFYELSQEVSKFSNISQSQAKTALLEITKVSMSTKQGMTDLAEAAVMFGRKTGTGTEEALKYFTKMRNGATKMAREMVKEGYDLLTAAQIEEIRHLDAIGEHEKANETLSRDLKESLKSLSSTTSGLSEQFQYLSSSISDAAGSFIRFITNTPTLIERTNTLKTKVAELQGQLKNADYRSPGFAVALAQLRGYQDELKKMGDAEQSEAKRSTNAIKERNKIEDDEWAEHYKKNDKRLSEELAHLKKYAAEKNLTIQESHEMEVAIRKRYEFKEPKTKGASSFSAELKHDLTEYIAETEKSILAQGRFMTALEKDQSTVKFYSQELKNFHGTQADLTRLKTDKLVAENRVFIDTKNAEIAKLRELQAEYKGDYQNQLIVQNAIISKFKEGTKEYEDEVKKRTSLEYDQSREVMRIGIEKAKLSHELQLEAIEDAESNDKILLERRKINVKEYIDLIKDQEKKKRDLMLDSNMLEMQSSNGDESKIEQLIHSREKIWRDYYKNVNKMSKQAAKEEQRPWDDGVKHFENSLMANQRKILSGQMSLAQGIKASVGDLIVYEIEQEEKKFIMKGAMALKDFLFGKEIAVNQGAEDILTNAAVAASGAYAATAVIPYVGPFLAPEAAASAYAATAAWEGAVSAEGGFRVPGDVTEMPAILHPEEKVLPAGEAHMNDEMYRMMKSNQNNSNSFSSDGGGDTHIHFSVSAIDQNSVAKFFKDNGALITKSLQNHYKAS